MSAFNDAAYCLFLTSCEIALEPMPYSGKHYKEALQTLFFADLSVLLLCFIIYVYIVYEPTLQVSNPRTSPSFLGYLSPLTRNIQRKAKVEKRWNQPVNAPCRLSSPIQQPPLCSNSHWVQRVKHRVPLLPYQLFPLPSSYFLVKEEEEENVPKPNKPPRRPPMHIQRKIKIPNCICRRPR